MIENLGDQYYFCKDMSNTKIFHCKRVIKTFWQTQQKTKCLAPRIDIQDEQNAKHAL